MFNRLTKSVVIAIIAVFTITLFSCIQENEFEEVSVVNLHKTNLKEVLSFYASFGKKITTLYALENGVHTILK